MSVLAHCPDFATSVALSDVWQETIGDNICVQGYPVWK